MDFDRVDTFDCGIIIKNVRNFELSHIFDCGQCFRWNRNDDESYTGAAFGKVIRLKKVLKDVYIYNACEEDFKNIWADYFDLYRDYSSIKEQLSKDPLLKTAVEFGNGMRILNQEPFEILISFIISANNMIPRIKKSVERICENFGEEIKYDGKTYYSFPTYQKLHEATIEDLEKCGVGFRAKYIKETVDRIYRGDADLNKVRVLDDDDCHESLKVFSGVGPKVADCIMLFSMGKYSAFPVDVWVKRAMQHFYLAPNVSLKKIRDFGRNKFGELSGFAQQYLFYYARENNINV